MNYLKAVVENDEAKKIAELKNTIILGEKLKKDVTPDKKKLEILIQRQEDSIKNPQKTISKESTNSSNIDLQNSIRSISTNENKIIIKFNKDYVKDDINKYQKKSIIIMNIPLIFLENINILHPQN